MGLRATERIAYSALALPLAAIALLLNAHLPRFYTDTVGVSVGFLATLMLAVRVFDAVTDPLIGMLSDRTPGRFGRRRPWILAASIPLAVTFVLLVQPGARHLVGVEVWLAGGIFALTLFWTAVSIPYEALGAALTFDYDERTSLLGLREVFLLAGTVLAAASPVVVRWILGAGGDANDQLSVFLWVGLVWGFVLLASSAWCGWVVEERYRAARAAAVGLRTALREVWTNRAFRILLVAYTVAAFGSHLPATMVLYYTQYVIGTSHGELILLLYLAVAIAALPLWIRYAHRTSKKRAWSVSLGVTIGCFVWAVFLGEGDLYWFLPIVVATGAAGGGVLALPHAMQADVIDADELETGQRREGQYIGLWSVAKKVSAALGVSLGLSLLELAGYEPNTAQPESVRWALRTAYILIPCLCFGLALLLTRRYPLGREEHHEIRRRIDERRREAGLATGP